MGRGRGGEWTGLGTEALAPVRRSWAWVSAARLDTFVAHLRSILGFCWLGGVRL